MTNKFRIYMAGPLFTLAEREHNLRLAAAIEAQLPQVTCVLPQQRAEALLPDLARVVADCLEQVREAGLVVACLEGPDADSGTAMEVGYAHGMGKPVIGYRTDFRGSEVDGVNAMLRFGTVRYLVRPAYAATLESLTDDLVEAIREFLP